MSTAILRSYVSTMVALVAGVVAVQAGWQAIGVSAWPVAVAVAVGWALAVTGFLRACGWGGRPLSVVTWAPVVVLTVPALAGWLSPPGLVLWGPLASVLAAGLAMTGQAEPRGAAESGD